MENRNIIIILLVIIVILAAAIGFALLNPTHAKEPTKLKITSGKTLTEGDKLSVKLTDLNGTPLDNQTINVSIIDKDGSVNHKSIVTNEKGKASLKLNKDPGKYSINCTFGGNDKYNSCNLSKKIKIEEKVENEESSSSIEQDTYQESSSQSNELHYDEEINVYYDDEGVVVDPDGEHGQSVGYSYSDLRDARDRWERGELEM